MAGIVGLAEAMRCTVAERAATVARVAALRDRLVDGLRRRPSPGCTETVPAGRKVAGTGHVCIEGVESEALLFLLERAGVYASAASSCATGAMEPSHVLAAMGVPQERAVGALRLSLGATTTDADVDRALAAVPPAVGQLAAGREASCASSSRCPAASTRRSPPRCWPRRATTSSASP